MVILRFCFKASDYARYPDSIYTMANNQCRILISRCKIGYLHKLSFTKKLWLLFLRLVRVHQSQTSVDICQWVLIVFDLYTKLFSTFSNSIDSPCLEVTGLRETPSFSASDSIENISLVPIKDKNNDWKEKNRSFHHRCLKRNVKFRLGKQDDDSLLILKFAFITDHHSNAKCGRNSVNFYK